MREDKTNLRTKNFSSSARYRFQAKTKHVNRKKGASVAGKFSDMSESFATSSGDFLTCRNRSPRRRETFRHVGIIRRVVGKLSDMSESFTAPSGRRRVEIENAPQKLDTKLFGVHFTLFFSRIFNAILPMLPGCDAWLPRYSRRK